MNGWVVAGVIAAACVAVYVAQRLGWVDLSNKNENSGPRGGVMGIGDEVFNPTRHEAQIELDRQTVLPAPAPLPGDSDKGIYRGRVEIDLDAYLTRRDRAADDPAPRRDRAADDPAPRRGRHADRSRGEL